jgi:hypothetical protein
LRRLHRCARSQCALTPAAPAHHQSLLAIKPVELLVV